MGSLLIKDLHHFLVNQVLIVCLEDYDFVIFDTFKLFTVVEVLRAEIWRLVDCIPPIQHCEVILRLDDGGSLQVWRVVSEYIFESLEWFDVGVRDGHFSPLHRELRSFVLWSRVIVVFSDDFTGVVDVETLLDA